VLRLLTLHARLSLLLLQLKVPADQVRKAAADSSTKSCSW
jgi:hypothetical protein